MIMYDKMSLECGTGGTGSICGNIGSNNNGSSSGGSSSSSNNSNSSSNNIIGCNGGGYITSNDINAIWPIIRRNVLQKQICFLGIMAGFLFGLIIGILFIPMFSITSTNFPEERYLPVNFNKTVMIRTELEAPPPQIINTNNINQNNNNNNNHHLQYKSNILDTNNNNNPADNKEDDLYTVVFLNNNIENPIQNNHRNVMMKNKRINDKFLKQSTINQLSIKNNNNNNELIINDDQNNNNNNNNIITNKVNINDADDNNLINGIIENNIYWGSTIENALPMGYDRTETETWNKYLQNANVVRLEMGCGRMQNRMVIFDDGQRACVRYRQNTDQIQGELFSFYLGQLLNITNLAPSAASIIDLDANMWRSATNDIVNAQWKSYRPVVLTKWLSDLDTANIPKSFQPLEKHLNKFDVKNFTKLDDTRNGAATDTVKSQKSIYEFKYVPLNTIENNNNNNNNNNNKNRLSEKLLDQFIELAQWSDLIVFDYIIANLDRVVNNLYNFQWNADIMAAPAHNLARHINSQLLVFLDNESGLLHGYRLLKKYEAYHGLLLDNLCVFRESTILALKRLRKHGVGHQLQTLFETQTSINVREYLPPLPEKSIKILMDRIDRVLQQVHKCQQLFSSNS